jgi:hypothetical protein
MEPQEKTDKELTTAEKIWADIKDHKIEMFSLPAQLISKFVSPVTVEPTKLYLTFTISAVLPVLEEALKAKYTVQQVDKWIVVSLGHSLPQQTNGKFVRSIATDEDKKV